MSPRQTAGADTSVAQSNAAATPAPAFVPVAAGSYEAQTARYHAALSAERGLTYRPRSPAEPRQSGRGLLAGARGSELAGETPAPEVRVKLRRAACGGNIVFDAAVAPDAQDEPAVLTGTGGLSLRRARGFEERFTPRGDGVEQSFLLERKPEGSGALEFLIDLELRSLAALPPRPGRAGGLLFVDTSGHVAARYGQVLVRDSGQHSLVLEPQLSVDGRSVSFAVPEAWLRTALWPVEVDPLVGSDFQISPDNAHGVAQPAVAAGANGFLVVWDDFTWGNDSPLLLAAVISPTGIASQPVTLSSSSGAPRPYRFQRTEIAFDGSNWLVVWSQDMQSGAEIHGALVSSGSITSNYPIGTLIGGTDFAIARTTGTVEEDPLAAFNGSDFVVAWTSGVATSASTSAASGSQIFFTRVTSAGIVASSQAIAAQATPPNQALLFLAPAQQNGDTLLLYRENSENPAQTRATRIAQDGTVRDTVGISLFQASQTAGGFGNPIGAAFVNTEWHILSSFNQASDSAVYLHRLSTTGVITPPQGVFAVVGLGPTGSTLDQYAPVFAGTVGGVTTSGNPIGDWLFLRNEKVNSTTYHILGKRVGFDGTDHDPIPFQVDTSTKGVLRNAVAAQCGSQFLAAWLDGRRASSQASDTAIVFPGNIFGALIDATVADNGVALLPAISASPTSGAAPLTVSFDAAGSSGSYDTLVWKFGDGSSSTSAAVSHRYAQNGTYIAQLALSKGYYSVFRTVVITVGQGGGTGSTSENLVGTPLQNSEGLVPNLFIQSASITLDFTQTSNDSVLVNGTVDISALPSSLTGLTGSVSIGSTGHPFALDSKGQFASDATQTPLIHFSLNAKSGAFSFLAAKDSLQAELDALGAKNATVSAAIVVAVPITVQLGTFSATSSVGMNYRATINKTGTARYVFLKAGQTVSGTFLITSFAATEQQLANGPAHTYSIRGVLVRPNGARYRPAASGNFIFEIGNHSTILPSSQFINKSGVLKFVARAGASGMKKFAISITNGKFNITLVKVPATGQNGSGLWLSSGTDIVDAAVNLSFQFDLEDQQQFTAGRYVYVARRKATAKTWKLQ